MRSGCCRCTPIVTVYMYQPCLCNQMRCVYNKYAGTCICGYTQIYRHDRLRRRITPYPEPRGSIQHPTVHSLHTHAPFGHTHKNAWRKITGRHPSTTFTQLNAHVWEAISNLAHQAGVCVGTKSGWQVRHRRPQQYATHGPVVHRQHRAGIAVAKKLSVCCNRHWHHVGT